MGGHVFINVGLGVMGECCCCCQAMLVLGNMGDIVDGGAEGHGDVADGVEYKLLLWFIY